MKPLLCDRCSFKHVSPYYFRTPSLCRSCFAKLPAAERAAIEAEAPLEPWEAVDGPVQVPYRKDFAYRRGHRIYQDVVFALMAGLLLWVALDPRNTGSTLSRIGVIVITIVPLGWYYYLFLKSPKRLLLEGGSLKAFYRGGRSKSWRLTDLARTRKSWRATLVGAEEFVDQRGRGQFLVWSPYLNDPKVLLSAVESLDTDPKAGHRSLEVL